MKKNIITAINTAIISFNFMKLKDVVALCILSLCATFASAQLSVTINAPNTTISCSNFGVSMTAIVTGGTAPFTYSWSSGCSNTASCIPTGNSNYTVTVTDATGQNTATNSVAITYNIISPIVQMQATSDTISCATPIVQLTASCTNVTNLTYAWANTSQTTQTIDVYTPGTYTVNATNTQNGCTASANYIVISDGTSPPNLRIVKTNDIDCSHAAAVYSAQSADSYLWSNGATTPTLTTTVAGLYTVTCTVGGYACAPSFTVTVAYDTVKPIIVMQSSGDLHCVGSYTLLYSSCTNCNFPGGMGYSWGGGTQQNTSSDMYVYQPGIYTVSAAAPNGCIGSASITVVRDTTPPTLALTSTGTTISCATNCVSLTATTNTANHIHWFDYTVPYSLQSTRQICSGGTYTVTVVNQATYCTTSASISIAQATDIPIVTIAASRDTLTCLYTTANLLASCNQPNVTYQWSPVLATTANFATVSSLGVYVVTATNAQGCSGSATIYINQDNMSANATITPYQSTLSCYNACKTIRISTTTPCTYVWSGGGSTADSLRVCTAGYYTVTVINTRNGCTSTLTSLIEPFITPVFEVYSRHTCGVPCSQNIVVATSTLLASYQWNNGSTNAELLQQCAGTYSVTATTAAGCSFTASATIVDSPALPPMQATLIAAACPNNNGSINLNNINNYNLTWNTGQLGNVITNTAGTYTVIIGYGQPLICTAQQTFIIPCRTGTIVGKVFYDENQNGVRDNNEIFIPNTQVETGSGNHAFYSPTNSTGTYYLGIDTIGNYAVMVSNLNGGMLTTPLPVATIATINDIDSTGNDIGIYYPPTMRDLSVYMNMTTVRPGFVFSNSIYYTNNFPTTVNNASVSFDMTGFNANFNNATPSPTSINGTIYTWNIGTILPFQSGSIQLNLSCPATTPLATPYTATASIAPTIGDINITDNSYTVQNSVTGSYDPNDKKVVPESFNGLGGTPDLDYTIRFQNTGTDTAFTVVVRDTLSNLLNISSLKILGSSHAYTYKVNANRELVFTFSNILLVDSTRNEPLSHGFVSYRIKPLANANFATAIENTAHIYFDYNLPVATNTARTSVYLKAPLAPQGGNFRISPNPTSGIVYLTANFGTYDIIVNDVFGRNIFSENNVNDAVHAISLANFAAGTYFITLRSNEKTVTEKVIKG